MSAVFKLSMLRSTPNHCLFLLAVIMPGKEYRRRRDAARAKADPEKDAPDYSGLVYDRHTQSVLQMDGHSDIWIDVISRAEAWRRAANLYFTDADMQQLQLGMFCLWHVNYASSSGGMITQPPPPAEWTELPLPKHIAKHKQRQLIIIMGET